MWDKSPWEWEGASSNTPCIPDGSGALTSMKLSMALKLTYQGLCRGKKKDAD